jgi:hypothetical protein
LIILIPSLIWRAISGPLTHRGEYPRRLVVIVVGLLGDHVVVVLFENRSVDNVLGRLYGPGDGKTFEGVIGKDLSNPIPEWAEHGADRKTVPYTVATDMDSPNGRSGHRDLTRV